MMAMSNVPSTNNGTSPTHAGGGGGGGGGNGRAPRNGVQGLGGATKTVTSNNVTNSTVVSDHTKEKATRAKVTLENYYANLIAQHQERESRMKVLERSMEEEGLSEDQKQVCPAFLVLVCGIQFGTSVA